MSKITGMGVLQARDTAIFGNVFDFSKSSSLGGIQLQNLFF
jgi:hypothetical protein